VSRPGANAAGGGGREEGESNSFTRTSPATAAAVAVSPLLLHRHEGSSSANALHAIERAPCSDQSSGKTERKSTCYTKNRPSVRFRSYHGQHGHDQHRQPRRHLQRRLQEDFRAAGATADVLRRAAPDPRLQCHVGGRLSRGQNVSGQQIRPRKVLRGKKSSFSGSRSKGGRDRLPHRPRPLLA
jgi:hypothetical protein